MLERVGLLDEPDLLIQFESIWLDKLIKEADDRKTDALIKSKLKN
jgi:hypothetical protein